MQPPQPTVADCTADLLRVFEHRDAPIEICPAVICARDLDGDARRRIAAELRRHPPWRLLPRIYAVQRRFGRFLRPDISPAPIDVAAALCRDRGWRSCMPERVARYLLGRAERPLQIVELGYDQPECRTYPTLPFQFTPAPPEVCRLSPLAQAIVIGVDAGASPKERSALRALARAPDLRTGLVEDLRRGLPTAAAPAFGEILIRTDPDIVPRQTPSGWTPPVDCDRLPIVEGWAIHRSHQRGDELLVGTVYGHPYIEDGARGFQSSPLIWLDEGSGYARTNSRLYRLGRRQPLLEAEDEP